MAYKTETPTGLKVVRDGNKFTFSWKKKDKDHDEGQELRYRINKGKWHAVKIKKDTTSKVINSDYVNAKSYHPVKLNNFLNSIEFNVRGKRKNFTKTVNKKTTTVNPSWSEWAKIKYDVKVPNKPSISAELDTTSSSTFSWSTDHNDKDPEWFRKCQIMTCLGVNTGASRPAGGWSAPWDVGDSGSITHSENTSMSGWLNEVSYTRWYAVQSQGAQGDSGWQYAHHVYAKPSQVTSVSVPTVVPNNAGGITMRVVWNAPSSSAFPIDEVTVQYKIAVPEKGMKAPTGSWTDAPGMPLNATGVSSHAFTIDDMPGLDECLWVRVNSTHDEMTTEGVPVLAYSQALEKPSGLSVDADPDTFRVTVSVTNNSDVPDSFLVVRYISNKYPNGFDIGIIQHGRSSLQNIQCPDFEGDSPAFAVRAVVGTYRYIDNPTTGVGSYDVTQDMVSEEETEGGAVPIAPSGVTVSTTDIPGTIRVTWNWSWADATAAELSWSSHADAWESTDTPSTFTVNNIHASAWNISGLDVGIKWYIRVRLLSGSGDAVTYGAYSKIERGIIDLASPPETPSLMLSSEYIVVGGSITAMWGYISTDGTLQSYAEIDEVTVTDEGNVYTRLISTETSQHIALNAEELGWSSGDVHLLALRVTSTSGKTSEWSAPVHVVVAEPLSCVVNIKETSLKNVTVIDDQEAFTTKKELSLVEMPLSVKVHGAGETGSTTVIIERVNAYEMARPDESIIGGYEGETIAIITRPGEEEIIITNDDLNGYLDDGAVYRIIANVKDNYGQMAELPKPIEFVVHWTHQAIIPEAYVEADNYNFATFITPVAPTGMIDTDRCDIYRLSTDKPQLVYENAEFGTKYVDPFPAIGDNGGHRIVFKTANGDYITEDNTVAWNDYGDFVETEYGTIIDFGNDRVELRYNIDISNKWEKDFEETRYLGGSVQGDWNPAVVRTGSVSAVALTLTDMETIQSMRRLAEYAGICHVRTKDGSSYSADVQVSEDYDHGEGHMIASFSLDITRVDSQELDGITFDQWSEQSGE